MADPRVINCKVIILALKDINNHVSPSLTYFGKVTNETKQTMDFCSRIRELIESKQIDSQTFQNEINSLRFNMDLFWIMSASGLLNLSTYVESVGNETVEANLFGTDLAYLCRAAHSSTSATKMFHYIFNVLSNLWETKKLLITGLILSNFVQKLVELVGTLPLNIRDLDVLLSFPNKAFIDRILCQALDIVIKKDGTTVKEIMGNQSKYRPSQGSKAHLTKTIVSHLQRPVLLKALEDVIHSGELINWNQVSCCIFNLLEASKDNLGSINHLVHGLLENSLASFSEQLLLKAILLGKIICLEASGSSLTFLQWYTSTFSCESNRPLNNEEKAKFFLNTMRTILDIEPPCYLQVYATKAPYVPSNCQRDLSEYLQLVKVHLLSMNQSVELGFFENTSGLSVVANDVDHLIKQIEATNSISPKFIASISFRRTYFEKTLLPFLLETSCEQSPSRHKVIEKLASLGKISNQLLANHRSKCSAK